MTTSLGLRKTAPRTRYEPVRDRTSGNRRRYDRRRRLSRRSEETLAYMLMLRDDPCWVCGENHDGRVQDVDHIVPLDQGGQDAWENMAAACASCNRGRKDRDLLQTLTRRTHG